MSPVVCSVGEVAAMEILPSVGIGMTSSSGRSPVVGRGGGKEQGQGVLG